MITRFQVTGTAKPKGSMRAFVPKGWTRAVITSASSSVKTWEQTIRTVAEEYSNAYTTSPVRVRLRFALPRPKSLPRQASLLHAKRPDVDKLARAVLDALTGIIWNDDAQVTSLHASKVYVQVDEPPKLMITILTP